MCDGEFEIPIPYNPRKLIELCQDILSDSEITRDELYSLAEFFNDNKEASDHWPGNQLIKPLQTIWEDGQIDIHELASMADLLVGIQNEWARRQLPPVIRKPISESFVVDVINAKVTGPKIKTEVSSQTNSSRKYTIDLHDICCSCGDWNGWRSEFPVGHLGRFCKHLLAAAKSVNIENTPKSFQAFITKAYPSDPGKEFAFAKVGRSDNEPILISNAPHNWADVHAEGKKGWNRYGYNVYESRWAYRAAPLNEFQIVAAINKQFG
jgi:hypothetical protein